MKSKLQKVGHVLKTSGIFTLKKERFVTFFSYKPFLLFSHSRKEAQKFHERTYLISGLTCLSYRQFKLPCSYLLVNVKVLSKLHRLHIIFKEDYISQTIIKYLCVSIHVVFYWNLSTHNHIYIAQLYFLQTFYRC